MGIARICYHFHKLLLFWRGWHLVLIRRSLALESPCISLHLPLPSIVMAAESLSLHHSPHSRTLLAGLVSHYYCSFLLLRVCWCLYDQLNIRPTNVSVICSQFPDKIHLHCLLRWTTALCRRHRELTKADVTLYRYLQLFCILFNDFNGSVLTVGFILITGVTSVAFIYLSLTYSYLSLFVFLLLPFIFTFCIIVLLFFNIPQHAKVRILSKELVGMMRSRPIGSLSRLSVKGRKNHVASASRCNLHADTLKRSGRALATLGIQIWFLGVFTLATSEEMMQQIISNILLLLSLWTTH